MAINIVPKKNGPYIVTGDLSELQLADADGNKYDSAASRASLSAVAALGETSLSVMDSIPKSGFQALSRGEAGDTISLGQEIKRQGDLQGPFFLFGHRRTSQDIYTSFGAPKLTFLDGL